MQNTQTTEHQDVVDLIRNDVQTYLSEKADTPYPVRSNWASRLGDKCLRRLVYYRTRWEILPPVSPGLQSIFETGSEMERIVVNRLNRIGENGDPAWRLVQLQHELNDKMLQDHQIGGRPDRFLEVQDGSNRPQVLGPVEIKTMDPNIYRTIQTVDSLNRYEWTRKYMAQLQIYMLGTNYEQGFFLLINKSSWYDFKLLPVQLDYEYAESLLEKAKAINGHVQNETLPDKLNDPDVCPGCPFEAICLPEYTPPEGLVIDDSGELEAILDRLYELKPIVAEHKDLEKQRDALLKKGQNISTGKWLVLWKKIEGERKPSPGGPYTMWRKKIIKADV